jgi:hypothetical protein
VIQWHTHTKKKIRKYTLCSLVKKDPLGDRVCHTHMLLAAHGQTVTGLQPYVCHLNSEFSRCQIKDCAKSHNQTGDMLLKRSEELVQEQITGMTKWWVWYSQNVTTTENLHLVGKHNYKDVTRKFVTNLRDNENSSDDNTERCKSFMSLMFPSAGKWTDVCKTA